MRVGKGEKPRDLHALNGVPSGGKGLGITREAWEKRSVN